MLNTEQMPAIAVLEISRLALAVSTARNLFFFNDSTSLASVRRDLRRDAVRLGGRKPRNQECVTTRRM